MLEPQAGARRASSKILEVPLIGLHLLVRCIYTLGDQQVSVSGGREGGEG